MNPEDLRIGLGWDRHRLVPGRPLILGAVRVPSELGLEGHSDGDVLLHAAIDALLGGSGAPDIGSLFPDTDPRFLGADSSRLAEEAIQQVRARGFRPLSLDAVLAAQTPKLAPFRDAMRESLAALFGLDQGAVNVKAKTGEGLGLVGRNEVLEATVVALLVRESEPGR